MPYKDRKKQLAYMRKYSKKRYQKQKKLQQAILQGDFDVARQIMETKPSIDVWGNSQPKRNHKKGRRG